MEGQLEKRRDGTAHFQRHGQLFRYHVADKPTKEPSVDPLELDGCQNTPVWSGSMEQQLQIVEVLSISSWDSQGQGPAEERILLRRFL